MFCMSGSLLSRLSIDKQIDILFSPILSANMGKAKRMMRVVDR